MKISNENAIAILNSALATGADYAEIYYQDNRTHKYSRRYHKVFAVNSGRTCGFGIRILKENQVVYGYTSDPSFEALNELALSLSLGFEGERIKTVEKLEEKKFENPNPIKIPHSAWTTEEKLSYLEKGEQEAYAVSSQVQDVVTSLMEEDEHVEIYNSDGVYIADDRTRTRIMVLTIASDGKQFQQDYAGPGLSKGLELLTELDYLKLCRESAETAVALLTAKDGPSGELPVVLGNDFGGVLFHEACGHPLEGSSICKNISPFAGKVGEMIASEVVTAIDDGTIESAWGSESVDDEGIKPTKNILIENGVLKSYMVDRYTARRIEGSVSTGSCRRESYRYCPTTRMTNTYIANGSSTPEEIIASVKEGIYCKGFTGGQVDPSTDQFIFTSDVAYLIKDGKITDLIKPVSLIGYGYEILKRITMVGNDCGRAPGVCGSSSGSCFVEVGQPTLLISKMLVGGAGGNE